MTMIATPAGSLWARLNQQALAQPAIHAQRKAERLFHGGQARGRERCDQPAELGFLHGLQIVQADNTRFKHTIFQWGKQHFAGNLTNDGGEWGDGNTS